MQNAKPFPVTKRQVWEAWKRVKANQGSGGIDGESIADFEAKLADNLYKLWNRIASSSYHPKPVRRVNIPKASGGVRPLGIPTVADRVAQMVVKMVLEPELDRVFHPDSYGYRPNKSAHDALDALAYVITRRKVNYIVDADIRKFFDMVDQEWLIRFLEHRIGDKRVIRLIIKWLNAGVMQDGNWQESMQGTPQGAVISPILANIYLHYVLDLWFQVGRKTQQWRGVHHPLCG